jgi:hypothetical protein
MYLNINADEKYKDAYFANVCIGENNTVLLQNIFV